MLGMHSLMLHCESRQNEREAVGSVELRVKKIRKDVSIFSDFNIGFLAKNYFHYNALLPVQQALLHDHHKCHI